MGFLVHMWVGCSRAISSVFTCSLVMCYKIRSCVGRDVRHDMCAMTHSHLWHDSRTRALISFPSHTLFLSRSGSFSLARSLSRAYSRASSGSLARLRALSPSLFLSRTFSLSLPRAFSLSPPPPHFLSPSLSIRRMCGKRLQKWILGVSWASKSFV